MNSPVTSNPAGRWPVNWRRSALVLGWAGLTLALFQPAQQVLDGELDPSIFAAYAYYTAHGFQFGPDLVAMAGPYGFIMYGGIYGGDLFWLRFFAELAVEGIFAALILWFFLRLPRTSWMRWLWFPAHLIFSTALPDLSIAWTMLLAGLCLLEDAPVRLRRWRDPLLAALLGLLALGKGTHLLLSAASVGLVVAAVSHLDGRRRGGTIAAGYAAGVIGFWLLAGQNPLHLPAYLRGTLHLAASYNEAMSLVEPAGIFRRGLLVVAGLALAFGLTAWTRRRNSRDLAATALLAGYAFVMWKHGFVRADAHTVIFFSFASVAVLAWYLYFIPRDAAAGPRTTALALVTALLLAGNLGAFDPQRPWLPYLAGRIWPSCRDHLDYVLRPAARRQQLEEKLAEQRALNQLPEIADAIGRAPIDFFGSQQGVLILNGFNYRPRPMGGGAFNVYDEYLMQLNRDFIRDPRRRPDFYLLKPSLVDNRFATQDDGLALLDLLHGYQPEILEQEFLLLRAAPAAPAPVPRVVARQTFRFGETVAVPVVANDEMLLARFTILPSAWGRVQAALYKGPPVTMALQNREDATPYRRRLVPVMARSPFILSPCIEDVRDVLDLYRAAAGHQPAFFTLSTPNSASFAQKLEVEFSVVPRPAAVNAYQLGGLVSRLSFPYANAVPESITPPFRTHPVLRYMHAPSTAVWNLTGNERELAFHYGIDPHAYTVGTTNGVDFIVEIRGPSGGVTPVFRRRLQPRTAAADRGQHAARVTLPVYAPGSRLVLRTDPGEYGDNSWDWSYVTRIDLRQGKYTADQFPGFTPLPDLAEGEHVGVVGLDTARVVMLHIPALARFKLSGHERHLTLGFGFMPGAYTAGGNTAGGDFVVELQAPGQAPREIFRTSLHPRTVAADRGPQTASVTLPPAAAGTTLTVRTLPAAGADNNWGWTYVSRLVIE
jgi:hypothetical protein